MKDLTHKNKKYLPINKIGEFRIIPHEEIEANRSKAYDYIF